MIFELGQRGEDRRHRIICHESREDHQRVRLPGVVFPKRQHFAGRHLLHLQRRRLEELEGLVVYLRVWVGRCRSRWWRDLVVAIGEADGKADDEAEDDDEGEDRARASRPRFAILASIADRRARSIAVDTSPHITARWLQGHAFADVWCDGCQVGAALHFQPLDTAHFSDCCWCESNALFMRRRVG